MQIPPQEVDVEEAGVDAGYSPSPETLRAPDVSVGNVPDAPGWIEGAPPLAVEYADTGQDEKELAVKISELFAAGTKLVWVVRLQAALATRGSVPSIPEIPPGVGRSSPSVPGASEGVGRPVPSVPGAPESVGRPLPSVPEITERLERDPSTGPAIPERAGRPLQASPNGSPQPGSLQIPVVRRFSPSGPKGLGGPPSLAPGHFGDSAAMRQVAAIFRCGPKASVFVRRLWRRSRQGRRGPLKEVPPCTSDCPKRLPAG